MSLVAAISGRKITIVCCYCAVVTPRSQVFLLLFLFPHKNTFALLAIVYCSTKSHFQILQWGFEDSAYKSLIVCCSVALEGRVNNRDNNRGFFSSFVRELCVCTVC